MASIRLATRQVEKPWGRRSLRPWFEAESPSSRAVGEIWFESEDPAAELLVKYLFTGERLSIQVHPDDGGARAAGHPRGKDEAWVILDAEPGAEIALGLKEPVGRDALRAAALDGSIERLLDWRSVKRGDVIYSPAGTIHAMGGGITLVEVQQNADLTYRLYDYGRPRELHLDEALAVADRGSFEWRQPAVELGAGRSILAQGRKFVLERWTGAGERRLTSDARTIWLTPLCGSGTLDGAPWRAGECWTATGEVEVTLSPDADLILAYPGDRPIG